MFIYPNLWFSQYQKVRNDILEKDVNRELKSVFKYPCWESKIHTLEQAFTVYVKLVSVRFYANRYTGFHHFLDMHNLNYLLK